MGHRQRDPIVLVIDDEPAIRDLFSRALATSGFFPVVAGNAEAALRLIEGGMNPDAILLDLLMPGMGGLGFLLQIRADPQRSHIPVAIVTANSLIPSSVRYTATALKAEIHFKPMEIDAILSLTERLVKSRGGGTLN